MHLNTPHLSVLCSLFLPSPEISDGKVDYVKYAPLAVNIIRLLNNPATLRQKAELIESQDLSVQSLVSDMHNGESFDRKLTTLFRTYDTNRNGTIDKKEFLVSMQVGVIST